MLKLILRTVSISLAIIGFFACLNPSYAETVPAQEELSLVGDIEARAAVMVFPRVPGKVLKLNVEVGSAVREGEVLAVVEHEELELGVRQARAALEAAKAGLHQTAAMAEVTVISNLRQAQAGLSAARITLQQVRDLSFTQTTTQIAQAEAGLEAIEASMKKIKEGARAEEKKQVEASVQQAKASLNNAESNYKRMKKLYEEGAVSEQTLEGLETQYTVAKAQYDAATQQLNLVNEGARAEDIRAVEAQVRQAQAALQMAKKLEETKSWEKDIALAEAQVERAQAVLEMATASHESKSWKDEIMRAEMSMEQARVALALAQKQLSDATITAPISGIISRRNIELGGMAAPQSPVFEIIDIDIAKAKVSIIEADLYRIKLGAEAMVSVDALKEPVRGEVTLISPVLDRTNRTTTVEISINNRDHKLKPGMFARARIASE
jgi:multidrug resistance efflux pump